MRFAYYTNSFFNLRLVHFHSAHQPGKKLFYWKKRVTFQSTTKRNKRMVRETTDLILGFHLTTLLMGMENTLSSIPQARLSQAAPKTSPSTFSSPKITRQVHSFEQLSPSCHYNAVSESQPSQHNS